MRLLFWDDFEARSSNGALVAKFTEILNTVFTVNI